MKERARPDLTKERERRPKGTSKLLAHLNIQLTNELTAINRYVLHARRRPIGMAEP